MDVTVHRLAGITFRTESNAPLPGLDEPPYASFRVADDEPPDVRHVVRRVSLAAPARPALTENERERLQQDAQVEPFALDSPFLGAPAVRAWLDEALDQPAAVRIVLFPDRAFGLDFVRRRLDFLYTDELGANSADLGDPAAVGETIAPGRCLRMHQVSPDPQRLPPLLAEERERFARQVYFWPPESLDHPVMRSRAVRARLHSDLDQAKEPMVSVHMEGLVLWTPGEPVLDFYYYSGFDDPRLARVVGSYPRVFCAFLPDFDALPVHSSGVIRSAQAALFLAPDEGGKSTVLRHAVGAPWLNDDQVIVRRKGDNLIAYATPLGRRTSGPGQARLGGLFVLEKALHFELTPLKPAGLVKTLWNEHLFYTSSLPRHLKLQAFDLLYDMCHQVPIYRMRFPKDYVDWDAIDAALVCR
jgi:hypothetical protein